MNNDYDSDVTFTDDYVSEEYDGSGDVDTSHRTTERDETISEVDAVAALLAGDDSKANQLTEQRGGKVSTKSVGNSIDVDQHGRMDFNGDSKPEPQQQPQQSSEQMISPEVYKVAQEAEQYQQRIQGAAARLEEMVKHGDLDQQTAAYQWEQLNREWQQAEYAKMSAKVQGFERQQQMQVAMSQLVERVPDLADPQKREMLMQDVQQWARSKGISDEDIASVDDPVVAASIVESVQAEKKAKQLELENKLLRQKVRESNRALGKGKKRAASANNMGNRHGGPVQEDQLDQIVKILGGK